MPPPHTEDNSLLSLRDQDIEITIFINPIQLWHDKGKDIAFTRHNRNNRAMKTLSTILAALLLTLSLNACSTAGDDSTQLSALTPAAGNPLLPIPGADPVHDPDDGIFMGSVSTWLEQIGAPANSQYEFTRVDLDNDGRREGLILLQSPHQKWCMEYGCTMYIFRAHDDGFSYLSEVSPVRGPLVVSELQTNGWRDIIAYVSGRESWRAKNVALQFDGRAYPAQPETLPPTAINMLEGRGVKIFP